MVGHTNFAPPTDPIDNNLLSHSLCFQFMDKKLGQNIGPGEEIGQQGTKARRRVFIPQGW